jgi:hypothetical protein
MSFLSKIIERVIHTRLTRFFSKYKLFFNSQFVFLKGKSTTDAILKFVDHCYSGFSGVEFLVSVFLDLSKAFDTVDHTIQIRKLEHYGIRGSVSDWFCSYLSGRQQYVDIDGKCSVLSPITCGVPQDSICGYLLFLIYINYMHKSSPLLNFIHFADDSTIFMRIPNLENCLATVNRELCRVDEWLCANRLSLNVSKCMFSILTNRSISFEPTIKIRDEYIKRVNKTKFLGITIDDNLSYKDHIAGVCSKVSRSYSILNKLSSFIPKEVLRKIYFSLVYPHFVYGVEIWGNSSKTSIDRLKRLQLKCVKLLSDDNLNICPFVTCNLLSFEQIYEYFCLIRFFKYYRLFFSTFLKDKILLQLANHEHLTRFRIN